MALKLGGIFQPKSFVTAMPVRCSAFDMPNFLVKRS